MSVPNQKIIKIAPREKRDKDHLYAMMNIDALQQAMNDLIGSSLKLWLYLNKNQDGYELELSRKACGNWGLKKDSYYDAVKDLIYRGYLQPQSRGSNIYYFHESPPSDFETFGELENRPTPKPTFSYGNPIPPSELERFKAEKTKRNNTYSTGILKDNTIMERMVTEGGETYYIGSFAPRKMS